MYSNLKRTRSDSGTSGRKQKAKRILSEDSDDSLEDLQIAEAKTECDQWDENCKVVKLDNKTNCIIGFHLMSTCLLEPKFSEDKKLIFKTLLRDILMNDFKTQWNSEKPVSNNVMEIIISPWKVCIIKELFEDASILNDVRQEFYELSWNRRRMDLYDFYQSQDLQHIQSPNIQLIYSFLKNDVMTMVGNMFDVNLTHISATCSFYADTDYLLVHDDKQEDRVIAFILYLTDAYDWKQSWGGALQMFNCDNNYQPKNVEVNIFPKNNQLILFPVSAISYHQVDEVTTKNFSRLSINGWFHGTVASSKIIPVSPQLTGLYSDIYIGSTVNAINLSEYINETYLMNDNIHEIQHQIEELSEISLPFFFKEEFFTKVTNVLLDDTLKWRYVGPLNRIHYEVLDECNIPKVLKILIDIFQSDAMFKLLECYTELEYNNTHAGMKYEIQKWSPGCYSLLSDYEWNTKQELDIILYFGCKNTVGGRIQYVTQEDEIQQALVTLEHKNNTLNLVFRDSARINCYVSKYTQQPFYMFVGSYVENNKI